MMEAIFRTSKHYLKGGFTHCGGGGPDGMEKFKIAVNFWNKTFNIDFFTLRKRLRRISYDILKSQTCIKKVHIYRKQKYENSIYAPMDDDDIFMITDSEYEECVSNFNENCNSIILGYYDGKYSFSDMYLYRKNPKFEFPIDTNNFLFKYEKSKKYCGEWTRGHNNVHRLSYVKYKELRHIETSLHLVHPCSITLLLPRHIRHKQNWTVGEEHRDLMAKLINEYVNETNYKKQTPSKFWSHLETFKSLFSEVKLK